MSHHLNKYFFSEKSDQANLTVITVAIMKCAIMNNEIIMYQETVNQLSLAL